MALEKEIRSLTENWREFCDHCQRVHDTEMVQAEHLATMGELAAGVAHEIRNPLAGIAGAIEIISKDFPKDHPDREILEDLRQEVRRIEKVLNDLLTYARPKAPQFGMADLKDTVAHTLQFARQQIGSKNVEFSIQIPSPLPRFRMDPEQLHQVLLNLVLNGIQALDQEGKITIQAASWPARARRIGPITSRSRSAIRAGEFRATRWKKFSGPSTPPSGAERGWGCRFAAASSASTAGRLRRKAKSTRGAALSSASPCAKRWKKHRCWVHGTRGAGRMLNSEL